MEDRSTKFQAEEERLQSRIQLAGQAFAGAGAVKDRKMKLIFPPPALCTDNGVMAAWAGIEKLNAG